MYNPNFKITFTFAGQRKQKTIVYIGQDMTAEIKREFAGAVIENIEVVR